MIFIDKTEVSEDDFILLLENSRKKVEAELRINDALKSSMNGVIFENFVYLKMLEAAVGSLFDGYVEQTGAHAFPDIIARGLYGIEVKMTVSDKWVSTGNSILETTRVEGVQTIYMFFGKFGKPFEAKYRKYQDCLSEVGVTHSPRYKIDMDLPEGKSIFHKIGVDYDVFRKEENPIKRLKDYYRRQLKEGEELWWIDPAADENSVSPVIKTLKYLDEKNKEQFINDVFILFPEIFSNSSVKFERSAAYLITRYNSVSSSLRDSFTAGGKMNVKIGDKEIKISRLLYNFYTRAPAIKKALSEIPRGTLSYYWALNFTGSPIDTWKKLVLKYSENSNEDVDIWSIFEQGVKNE